MSERKVLNKYYPPDFDPSKIPRLRLSRERQYTVRLMAPCNMRCTTCGEYIYKGKKFNARKETVQGEEYLGISIFRFYIKCTRCLAEITFKTDPRNTDYEVEHGATRNFQALKLAEEQAEREEQEQEEEEKSNPMKILEKRTKASKNEMEVIENLEELQELNERQASVNFDGMLQKYADLEQKIIEKQQLEDENFIQSVFGKNSDKTVKRIEMDSDDSDEDQKSKGSAETKFLKRPSSSLLIEAESETNGKKAKVAKPKKNSLLAGLVKPKKAAQQIAGGSQQPPQPQPKVEVVAAKPSNSLALLSNGYMTSSDEGSS